LVVGAAAGVAVSGGYRFSGDTLRVDHQTFVSVKGSRTTSSRAFTDVLAWIAQPAINNRGAVTVTFSGDFSGGSVELRALKGERRVLKPGVARFNPGAGTSSFSFTFVSDRMRPGCRKIGLQWRSPSGALVTLNYGDLVVDFHRVKPTGICE
jgi:hypothetical protein